MQTVTFDNRTVSPLPWSSSESFIFSCSACWKQLVKLAWNLVFYFREEKELKIRGEFFIVVHNCCRVFWVYYCSDQSQFVSMAEVWTNHNSELLHSYTNLPALLFHYFFHHSDPEEGGRSFPLIINKFYHFDIVLYLQPCYVSPCHHGKACLQVIDMESRCQHIV